MIIQLSKFPALPLKPAGGYPRFEFHVRADLRTKYQIDESLFQSSGNVVFPNYRAVRELTQKINVQRPPKQAVRAGQLNAMGLIDEIYHYVLRVYETTANPKVFARALATLTDSFGGAANEKVLREFTAQFPPTEVYRRCQSADEYLNGSTGDKPHREVTLEEIILLFFANFNPAFKPFRELFDDQELSEHTIYAEAIERTDQFFGNEKPFGSMNQTVFELLRAPILASPNSLEGQLDYIRQHWGLLIGDKFLRRLLSAHDLIVEDMRIVFPGGRVQTFVPTYRYGDLVDLDYERFTSDLEWMPKVVLMAKNIYVWLHQLSVKYGRPITKLNEIPDEALDELSRWGFTGLWLIGVWERSPASQKIKQWMGNPEAVSSAYSVYEYDIASDIGGEEAFGNLARRAWARGIRLAGDMVPNHMGIYSKWVIEHPEYFIQSSYKPYPNYQFTGGNLSDDPRIDIRIEDGYWSRRDAAVVFQRTDTWTGDVRYIYHGNDGTSMPWNDTAQLDFLKKEVREAVIQMIFHVARKFSIIRFDAAMTLTKRHFQRLWYPQPGTGGAIPSRADFGLTKEEFDKLFPDEFWREVVDRINAELPNTLLLAEAFWLLEGYFVRTLGMHRVYNSAFMNMLKMEENAKYRELIRTTLHYNPEILKRYVNFMSNPDEETAIAQFGRDDKYFGVCVMMVTLPGLPMFAHGQIEGYTEKYGMEYKRAYYEEQPDQHLVWRHEREIFPLITKRHLFSQVTQFELYDFVTPQGSGHVNENVFAYSNKSGGDRALVCYHNKYEETAGWIKHSVGKTSSSGENIDGNIVHRTLGEALELNGGDNVFYIFKDYRTNLEYIRAGRELHERGLYVELKAFQYHVFLDFREVFDSAGDYGRIAHHLNGAGVPDVHQAMRDLQLAPVNEKLRELVNGQSLEDFLDIIQRRGRSTKRSDEKLDRLAEKYQRYIQQIAAHLGQRIDVCKLANDFRADALALTKASAEGNAQTPEPVRNLVDRRNALLLFSWMIVRRLNEFENPAEVFEGLQLDRSLSRSFDQFGYGRDESRLLEILFFHHSLFTDLTEPDFSRALLTLLDRQEVHEFLYLNQFDGVWYFNKERFEELVDWLHAAAFVELYRSDQRHAWSVKAYERASESKRIAEKSGYRFEDFRDAFQKSPKNVPTEQSTHPYGS